MSQNVLHVLSRAVENTLEEKFYLKKGEVAGVLTLFIFFIKNNTGIWSRKPGNNSTRMNPELFTQCEQISKVWLESQEKLSVALQ